MDILYISALEGGKYTGPMYSVPQQIMGQKKYDNVYWINLTEIDKAKLFDDSFYHYIPWRLFKFSDIPSPFDKPNLIVFEEFFKIECCGVARKAEKCNIPYIIIPRCQMTENYLKNKKIKKIAASILLFNHFAKKSLAVQFLTEQEKIDSALYYSGESFIAPNGILIQSETAVVKQDSIVGTFIGRYSIWQKGLDLLIEAIDKEKEIIKRNNIIFRLYGPNDRTSFPKKVKSLIIEKGLSEIVEVKDAVYDAEKKNVLLSSSFFVHTSRFEGMPMSVLEALSYGVPCLVTQGNNMRECVEEYNAGWGADNTVESISNAIISLCNSIDKIELLGSNAKQLSRKFSWDSISKVCHEKYLELLK